MTSNKCGVLKCHGGTFTRYEREDMGRRILTYRGHLGSKAWSSTRWRDKWTPWREVWRDDAAVALRYMHRDHSPQTFTEVLA